MGKLLSISACPLVLGCPFALCSCYFVGSVVSRTLLLLTVICRGSSSLNRLSYLWAVIGRDGNVTSPPIFIKMRSFFFLNQKVIFNVTSEIAFYI
jgi:hypothetical protein